MANQYALRCHFVIKLITKALISNSTANMHINEVRMPKPVKTKVRIIKNKQCECINNCIRNPKLKGSFKRTKQTNKQTKMDFNKNFKFFITKKKKKINHIPFWSFLNIRPVKCPCQRTWGRSISQSVAKMNNTNSSNYPQHPEIRPLKWLNRQPKPRKSFVWQSIYHSV